MNRKNIFSHIGDEIFYSPFWISSFIWINRIRYEYYANSSELELEALSQSNHPSPAAGNFYSFIKIVYGSINKFWFLILWIKPEFLEMIRTVSLLNNVFIFIHSIQKHKKSTLCFCLISEIPTIDCMSIWPLEAQLLATSHRHTYGRKIV